MSNAAPPLNLAQLEQALLATDPAVCLAEARVVRRVITADRRIVGFGLRAPHAKSYVISRDALLRLVDLDEIGVTPGRPLPETVILLLRPEPQRLEQMGRDQALVAYWRLLFHARIHQELERRAADGKLTAAGVHHRVQSIGPTEFDAARVVLRHDNYLLPPRDDRTVYIEFAALFLELRYFDPGLLPHYFPGLADHAAVEALLAEDLDAAALFEQTRLPGAPPPKSVHLAEAGPAPPPREVGPREHPSDRRYRSLVRQADRARASGNVVRAAIVRMQASAAASPKTARAARNAARSELAALVDRLRPALQLSDDEVRAWHAALPALLPPAARGIWPVEARLLYDLQKVCSDHERELYAADLVEWALSLGRRPVKRPLPQQREVLLLKHLRSAARRLTAARIPEEERRTLTGLLDAVVGRCEARLRERFRSMIASVLDEVGLVPANLPERVARDKLVEELLDQVVDHGFLTIGDLRDAIARGRLKLPNLAVPRELLLGDQLGRANQRLASVLDGVYLGAEIYLRWLQRLTAAVFGTRLGRWLMRFVALPFGGAYVALAGLQYLIDEVYHLLVKLGLATKPESAVAEMAPPHKPAEVILPLSAPWSVGLLGLFLLLLLHVPPFRRVVWRVLTLAYRGLHAALVDLPTFLLHWPPLRRVLDSRVFVALSYYLFKPAVVTGLVSLLVWLAGTKEYLTPGVCVGTFLGANILINSRLGRTLEEIVVDRLAQTWERLSIEVVPAVIHFFLDLFKRLLGGVDRLVYAVDEWLRFRSSEGRQWFVAKAVAGLAWFMVAYFVRMNVVLWIEPTFNPIKHFPTVTVAAKVILPLYVLLLERLEPSFGAWVANSVASAVLVVLPGVIGFLVWELTASWRLYRANRPLTLQPVRVGSHGETVVGLLRPGLHSGTLPKLYARLRRAQRRARRGGEAIRKYLAALHEVEESVRHFLQREFLALLNASSFWRGQPVALGTIELGSNRIRAELCCPTLAAESVWLAFEERSGWLLAGVTGPGWLGGMSVEQRSALTTALAGLYKLAGVDLVRQQVEAVLPSEAASYDVVMEGLVVWSGIDFAGEAVYPLDAGPVAEPRTTVGSFTQPLPPLPVASLRFDGVEVTWNWWVETWEGDRTGKPHSAGPLEGVRLLPESEKTGG